jgi:uncharacterized membrane protein YoaK (UPF0700 family)
MPFDLSRESAPGAAAARVPVVLAFVAGFVDVQCYLGLQQTFAAFMTGTLIALGSELADPTAGATTKAAMIATFVPAAALGGLALRWLRGAYGEAASVRRLLFGEACLLVGLTVAGGLLAPFPAPGSWQMIVVAVLAVSAMTVQNVVMVHLLAYHPATTVMTLNMVHMIGFLVGAAPLPKRDTGPPPTDISEAGRYAVAIVPFLAGVVGGAFGHRSVGFWSVAVPAAALFLLVAWLGRRAAGDGTGAPPR